MPWGPIGEWRSDKVINLIVCLLNHASTATRKVFDLIRYCNVTYKVTNWLSN